ncbi:hypothetical protein HanXRQr2_Chr10g0433711 [Helianthus annuus]|uniref:Uncharacterized protein n=1 Tax=Helianthus annuus TaxID=4232 RepID=A0A251THG2_HELAN|nr:hypothetical protein HanXRQr2_Chr10g0433711 [Helianthus annuus]
MMIPALVWFNADSHSSSVSFRSFFSGKLVGVSGGEPGVVVSYRRSEIQTGGQRHGPAVGLFIRRSLPLSDGSTDKSSCLICFLSF